MILRSTRDKVASVRTGGSRCPLRIPRQGTHWCGNGLTHSRIKTVSYDRSAETGDLWAFAAAA